MESPYSQNPNEDEDVVLEDLKALMGDVDKFNIDKSRWGVFSHSDIIFSWFQILCNQSIRNILIPIIDLFSPSTGQVQSVPQGLVCLALPIPAVPLAVPQVIRKPTMK